MIWKRKRRNRHGRREEVLDVKVYSQKVRAARWRMAATALAVSAGTLIGLFLLLRGTEWTLNAMVFKNEALSVRRIEVQTDGAIAPEQIRQWAGVAKGDNLAKLDLANIRRNLELAPLIKHASVERVMPDTLRLRVTEREPMVEAHVLVPRADDSGYDIAAYYLDDEGYVMLPMEKGMQRPLASAAADALPILTGLNRSDLRPGRPVESAQVMAALKLIEAFENSPMFGLADLARIDLSWPDVLQVTTQYGSEITFSLDRLETQLLRWRAIYDVGARAGKGIASLDLSVTNNVPTLWVEASAATPEKPKAVKTIRHKKKNV
jgi:hypothetical protein